MNTTLETQYSAKANHRFKQLHAGSNIFTEHKDIQRFISIMQKHPKEMNLILRMYAIRGT